MRNGDIVKVIDGSYAYELIKQGELKKISGIAMKNENWQIVCTHCVLPAWPSVSGPQQNDTIILGQTSGRIVFIQNDGFCSISRPPIKIGNKYRNKLNNKVYMLASTGNYEVALVDIDTGERLRNNCVVGDVVDISDQEFYKISGDRVDGPRDFELIHGRIVFDS